MRRLYLDHVKRSLVGVYDRQHVRDDHTSAASAETRAKLHAAAAALAAGAAGTAGTGKGSGEGAGKGAGGGKGGGGEDSEGVEGGSLATSILDSAEQERFLATRVGYVDGTNQ